MTKKNDKHNRIFEYEGEQYAKMCCNCVNEAYVTVETRPGTYAKFCILNAVKVRGKPYRGIDSTIEAKGACAEWKLDPDTIIDMTPVHEDDEI